MLVECDISAAVAVFSSGKGQDNVILACALAIWRHAADIDCALVFRHVPGEFMDAADALSRAPLSQNHKARAWQLVADRGLRAIEINYISFDVYVDPMYDAFLREAAATQVSALRPDTRMAYNRAVKLSIAFSVRYQRSYFQPQITHILAFIQYLTTAMTSPASIRNIISSLSSTYTRLGWNPSPFSGHFVQAALKSIDVNSRYKPTQKEAIAPDQLDAILAMVLAATKDYSLVCLLSFGFSRFFRQSNMAPSSAKVFDPTRQFTRVDVSPGVQGLTVKVKWTKTLQKVPRGHISVPTRHKRSSPLPGAQL